MRQPAALPCQVRREQQRGGVRTLFNVITLLFEPAVTGAAEVGHSSA